MENNTNLEEALQPRYYRVSGYKHGTFSTRARLRLGGKHCAVRGVASRGISADFGTALLAT